MWASRLSCGHPSAVTPLSAPSITESQARTFSSRSDTTHEDLTDLYLTIGSDIISTPMQSTVLPGISIPNEKFFCGAIDDSAAFCPSLPLTAPPLPKHPFGALPRPFAARRRGPKRRPGRPIGLSFPGLTTRVQARVQFNLLSHQDPIGFLARRLLSQMPRASPPRPRKDSTE